MLSIIPNMNDPVSIPTEYQSQYGLLGAMAGELAAAFRSLGHPVNESAPDPGRPGIYLFFNSPADRGSIPDGVLGGDSKLAVIQFFVDHPFALNDNMTRWLSGHRNYCLALPCLDSLHVLRLRWPHLKHAHVFHGVSAESIRPADADPIAGREYDVVIAGSVLSAEEISALASKLPPRVKRLCDDVAGVLLAMPHTTFEQGMDIVFGSNGSMINDWDSMCYLWRYVVGLVNRTRRLRLIEAFQGRKTLVIGRDTIAGHCRGTIEYGGSVGYPKVTASFARARTAIAMGPTQFTHTHSERALLSMAARCATVLDDRLQARTVFVQKTGQPAAAFYDASNPDNARAAAEALLDDRQRLQAMAETGHALVSADHTWRARTAALTRIASGLLATAAEPSESLALG